ncbi:MAG: hypothetical protein HLUCCX14_03590 [Marinobacter excellens HL-55]|uniref:Uncharacterized protein n=1 Tax=Marinobacter excellens HL-55 TaxID=1305731 RepID=A0A0P8BPB1_9GAMM|nr:MAG: hypothetical protein HLUCCX14_03590 [Marinobacter excellens HL-55]
MFFIRCIPVSYPDKIVVNLDAYFDSGAKHVWMGKSFSKHAYKHIHVGSFGPSLALNGFEKLFPIQPRPII